MGYLTLLNGSRKSLVKSAGGVLYLDARQATGSSRPANSPLTSPWVDLSGNGNNATPTNMAGTTSSGVDASDPARPFWVLDGTDDFFSLVNTSSVDITSAPLAVFATIKANPLGGAGYILCKNTSASTDIQYALSYTTSSQSINVYLEGSSRKSTANSTAPYNTWINVGFIWDSANAQTYVNQLSKGSGAYSGNLTSRTYARIGRREPASGYFYGNISTLTVYTGSSATESNILKAEREISKAYIGG